jgi:hypothetical protein
MISRLAGLIALGPVAPTYVGRPFLHKPKVRQPHWNSSILFLDRYQQIRPVQKEQTDYQRWGKTWKAPVATLLRSARGRAQKRGLSFTLNKEWLIDQLEALSFECSVTGVQLTLENGSAKYLNPYAPSIDRMDPTKGYDPDNCRVVCLRFNHWKGEADDRETFEFAKLLALGTEQ